VWIVPGVALLLGALPLPYAYYELLRVLVAGFAAYFAWKEFDGNEKKVNSFTWIFGVIAVLFNPFLPIHLTKGIWVVVDLAVAASLFWHLRMRWKNSRG